MTRKLFVYGSLCNGMTHFSKIQQYVSSIKEAAVVGRAYMLKVGYPVVIVSDDPHATGDLIPGQILEIQGSELLGHLLDEFHGCSMLQPEKGLHHRKQIQAQLMEPSNDLDQTSFVLCDLYSLNPSKLPKDAILIPHGDWRQYFCTKSALPGQLSERQRQYVQKLGASSGREIVPIDLPLYRELMNLGLIVDKGRRLALSALGRDVFRYL